MNVRGWLCAGIVALGTAVPSDSRVQEKKDENDPRFHPLLLAVAKAYEPYGRVDDVIRFAPALCRVPPPEPVRLSARKDTSSHGQKLYYLYAWDAASYLKSTKQDSYKTRHVPPSYDQKPAEQVLVKQSWTCVPAKEEPKGEARSRFIRKNGELMTTGEKKDLFVMIRLAEKTEGTDKGWVYGTVTPDGKSVTSSGRVQSCMACHETAGDGRLFGLPKPDKK